MPDLTPRQRANAIFTQMLYTRDDLLQRGMTARGITSAIRAGYLIRLRRNRYARPGLDDKIAAAARTGGRLTCLSLLQLLGVFVRDSSALHVQVARNSSRLRIAATDTHRLHWANEPVDALLHVTSLASAVRHAVRCQPPRAAVATLDSLLHHGLLTASQLETLFRALPVRFHALLRLLDPSAESGPETLVRLILRTLGLSYETQVFIEGVGRVDFVVDGWLVIECDSKRFHAGWEKQREDRARDLAAASLGYVTVRLLAADILHRPNQVQTALREITDVLGPKLAARSVRNSGRNARKGR